MELASPYLNLVKTCSKKTLLNYKGFHSITMQAICDCKVMFVDIDCRWPGFSHSAKVFAIYNSIQK